MPITERKYTVSCTAKEVVLLLATRVKIIVKNQIERKIERPDEISVSQLTAICNLLFSGPDLSGDVITHWATALVLGGYGSIYPNIFKLSPSFLLATD